MKSLSSLKYSTRYPPLSPLDYVPFILSNFFYRIFVSKWNEFRNPRKKIQKKGKRKGAEQTLSRNTGASSRLLACHTASFTCLISTGIFTRIREFAKKTAYAYRLRLRKNAARNNIGWRDFSPFDNAETRRWTSTRCCAQAHDVEQILYWWSTGVFYFHSKYCGKVKQTCKPGAPAKIPVAPGPLRPTPVSTLLWKLPIKNLISPKMLANSSNFPQKSI